MTISFERANLPTVLELNQVMYLSRPKAMEFLGYEPSYFCRMARKLDFERVIISGHAYYLQSTLVAYKAITKRKRAYTPTARLEKAATPPKGYCGKCKQAKAAIGFEDFDGLVKRLCWECWEGY